MYARLTCQYFPTYCNTRGSAVIVTYGICYYYSEKVHSRDWRFEGAVALKVNWSSMKASAQGERPPPSAVRQAAYYGFRTTLQSQLVSRDVTAHTGYTRADVALGAQAGACWEPREACWEPDES